MNEALMRHKHESWRKKYKYMLLWGYDALELIPIFNYQEANELFNIKSLGV